jgi:hypothetical protein
MAIRLGESQQRRRQALEINDNIVQGLAIAKYWAQRGQTEESIQAIDETLGRARRLITDQLQRVAHGRTTATRLSEAVPPPSEAAADAPPAAPVSAE